MAKSLAVARYAYVLSSKVYKEQDNIVGYVRQTGIDAVKYEAWIMELIQKQGRKITRDNVVKLLNVTPSQAYRLLKKCLIKEGLSLLEMDGQHIMNGLIKRTTNLYYTQKVLESPHKN